MNDNLKTLYDNTQKLNPSFKVDYDTFVSDMQDENNRKSFYSNLQKLNPNFQVSYNQFSNDMGFSNNTKAKSADEQPETLYRYPDGSVSSELPNTPNPEFEANAKAYERNQPNLVEMTPKQLQERRNEEQPNNTSTASVPTSGENINSLKQQGMQFSNNLLTSTPNYASVIQQPSLMPKESSFQQGMNTATQIQPNPKETEGNWFKTFWNEQKRSAYNAQNMAGETANAVSETGSVAKKALDLYDELKNDGVDINNLTKEQLQKHIFDKQHAEWEKRHPGVWDQLYHNLPFVNDQEPQASASVHEADASGAEKLLANMIDNGSGSEKGIGQAFDEVPYDMIKDASKSDNPRAYLEQKANEESWGQKQMASAAKKIDNLPTPTGLWGNFGAQAGSLAPFVASTALQLFPETAPAGKILSKVAVADMAMNAASESMMASREYGEKTGKDIPESDVWGTGLLSGLLFTGGMEAFGGMLNAGTKKIIGSKIAKSLTQKILSSPEATKEMGDFFSHAKTDFPLLDKFSLDGIKSYGGDVLKGTATLAGIDAANQLVPMIYENKKDYPTLTGIIMNEVKNLPSTILTNAFLSGEGKLGSLVNNYTQNVRRIKQGNVVLADAGKQGVVEVIGGGDNYYTVLNKKGEQINVPDVEIGETHTVPWNEFKEYAKAPKDKAQAAFDNLKDGEKRIITDNFKKASDMLDKEFEGSDIPFDKQSFLNSSKKEQTKIINDVENNKNLTEEQKNAIYNFAVRGDSYARMNNSFNENVENVAEKSVDVINKNVNPDMGGIVRAKVSGSDRQIMKGNIVQNEDGTINREKSDQQVYYKDDDGKTQVAPISNVEEVIENTPTADAVSFLSK